MDINQLPQVIQTFLASSNKPDPEVYVDCFSEDAIVVDEGKERQGKEAIKKWSEEYHFGANVTLEPLSFDQAGEKTVLVCKIDGDYDKTGLPDPLCLNYDFSLVGNHISELKITLAR